MPSPPAKPARIDLQGPANLPEGPQDIQVTGPGGTAQISVYFLHPPVITSITPVSLPVIGGSVVITGSGFTGLHSEVDEVVFRTTKALSFTVDSDTRITAMAPPNSTGPVDIAVRKP